MSLNDFRNFSAIFYDFIIKNVFVIYLKFFLFPVCFIKERFYLLCMASQQKQKQQQQFRSRKVC